MKALKYLVFSMIYALSMESQASVGIMDVKTFVCSDGNNYNVVRHLWSYGGGSSESCGRYTEAKTTSLSVPSLTSFALTATMSCDMNLGSGVTSSPCFT